MWVDAILQSLLNELCISSCVAHLVGVLNLGDSVSIRPSNLYAKSGGKAPRLSRERK